MQPNNRLRELDFLRGIAVILVLFRHQLLFSFLKTMGWIGVDLFFVLSGFLVSGLLFKEYQKFGSIRPKLFLIRRGFKIYPIFYLTYFGYMIPRLLLHKIEIKKVFYDLIFVQNYTLGWGYAYAASWSLAVEEHFYFGLALLSWFLFKKNIYQFFSNTKNTIFKFEKVLLFVLIFILILRFISNIVFPELEVKNITMTHLRIDSLLFGVLISYWFHFKREDLELFFFKIKKSIFPLIILLLSFTPFIEYVNSFFIKTIGFTMVYVAFGLLLIYFMLDKKINNKLNRIFSLQIVNYISKIGFCSYSIYIIHSFVINIVGFLNIQNQYLSFFLVFIVSVYSGFLMTYKIENFFLNYRDKYFPNRIN
jgi:peptidoglycan/LPS O-acetylase OafA/YrhL